MISRILVPKDARPAVAGSDTATPRRLSTRLDSRTVVPADLPVMPLDGRTTIPGHVPLEVLAARVVVARELSAGPLETRSAIPRHPPMTVLDSRVAVPGGLPPVAIAPKGPVPLEELPGVLEPDVLTTGEVNLLAKPVEARGLHWHWAARISSVVFHAALVVLVLLQPKLFPYRTPTSEQMEIARRQLAFIYLPPEVLDVPTLPRAPSEPTSPQVRIDPRVLRQLAPPSAELQPLPGVAENERVQRDLPAPPAPQGSPNTPETRPRDAPRETVRLESPKTPEGSGGLLLPRSSPGKALEESLRDALRGRGSTSGLGGAVPSSPGGGGTSYLGGNVEMLTPTEGVDFTNYLARILASVKRNWYAVIPESARLGEKGRVVLQFRILHDGNVPFPEPALVMSSGKEPLDRASLSSIRASSPFEPLPPAFSGPFIELRFIFLYNLPLDYQ